MDYDYEQQERILSSSIKDLDGQKLVRVLVQLVEHEFNVVYLIFESSAYAVSGRIGSEVVGITKLPPTPTVDESESELTRTIDFEPFSIFLGRSIAQARVMGTAWNGHGVEISFEGLPDRTMIIQSIYAGDKPTDFDDCLRLGVGEYWHAWPRAGTT